MTDGPVGGLGAISTGPIVEGGHEGGGSATSLIACDPPVEGLRCPALVGSARKAPLSMWVGFHGALFTAWLLLFLAQTLLVGRGRLSAHRSLGYVGAAVALLMIGSGYVTAVAMARRGDEDDACRTRERNIRSAAPTRRIGGHHRS